MDGERVPEAVAELIGRSHRLGADRRNTNFGGGNTSAKGSETDPTNGKATEVMWIKGSGGDLGSLQVSGIAAIQLDRIRGLRQVYRGVEHEDEMHQLVDHCIFGSGGAAPSIDTSMHALIDAPHVDHLHPDSIIAIAASTDGEALTKRCFGEDLAWVPWRRPGFELALEIETLRQHTKSLRGVVMGGHGLTTWGASSEECEKTSLEMIRRAAEFLEAEGCDDPLGPVRDGFGPLDIDEMRDQAAELAPFLRGLAGTDLPVVGHWFKDDLVLDFLSRSETPRVVPLGTSCPDHFIRTKVRPLLLDLPPAATLAEKMARLQELHVEYRAEYKAYYDRYADESTPAMRGADPAIFLIPGVGMFSFGVDTQTARVAGEFYINAINVIRGAESVSTYDPVSESEKFRVEYWLLEELKLRNRPAPKPLTGKVALVTGGGSGIGRAISQRLAELGAAVAVADIDLSLAESVVSEIGGDVALALRADVASESEVAEAVRETVLAYGGVDILVNNAGLSLSRSLLDTTEEDWDHQFDVMSKGSFLMAKYAARAMITQGAGGDIIYVVSKNSVVAGPNNLAYGSAKASQAHQVRLLAAELGEHAIRVNGVNPDGVVQGSGIFAGGWGAERAKVYGVPEDELGRFYAGRTLLKQEVLPEHVANAVGALVGGDFSQTTGVIIPVDSGVVSAFLR